ncbi:hypothetical protein EKO04_002672 [Ascochyta lentis]|uniref:Uncharacterized protein n=1 Tax=Ascochyta lentis TaxID=205686 RepID=A0A8H7J887_9PLEO|nr:hypothetical protein EKO04_002672 [Ascochyta lentis]
MDLTRTTLLSQNGIPGDYILPSLSSSLARGSSSYHPSLPSDPQTNTSTPNTTTESTTTRTSMQKPPQDRTSTDSLDPLAQEKQSTKAQSSPKHSSGVKSVLGTAVRGLVRADKTRE